MKIPTKKIKGQRVGQIIYNSIVRTIGRNNEADITSHLFYIENESLQKLINSYLKSYVHRSK